MKRLLLFEAYVNLSFHCSTKISSVAKELRQPASHFLSIPGKLIFQNYRWLWTNLFQLSLRKFHSKLKMLFWLVAFCPDAEKLFHSPEKIGTQRMWNHDPRIDT